MSAEYKSVRLDIEAYRALERRKRPDESFSDVVSRLARERPITDLAGVLDDEAVESIREARRSGYERYVSERTAGGKGDEEPESGGRT